MYKTSKYFSYLSSSLPPLSNNSRATVTPPPVLSISYHHPPYPTLCTLTNWQDKYDDTMDGDFVTWVSDMDFLTWVRWWFSNWGFLLIRFSQYHCMRSVRIQSFSGPYLLALGVNSEIYTLYGRYYKVHMCAQTW